MTTDTLGRMPEHATTYSAGTVPPGYAALERGGAWFRALGPLYQRQADDGTVIVAVRVSASHANVMGIAHGGMLMTLADGAMGINLNLLRFLSAAQVGDWLEAHTRIRRNGKRLAFVECTLKVGEREVLHASGTFLPI